MNTNKSWIIATAVAVFGLASTASAADYYVSATGSNANDGLTRETAFLTIANAVSVAQDGDTICVLAGTYEIATAISVTEALTIIGDTGDPAEVIVRNTAGTVTTTTGANSDTAHRVFEINHVGAVLSGIAVEGGKLGGYADYKGGNILIDSNGGTVTNCIIRNAIVIGIGPGNYPKNGTTGAGIACLSASGLITHCVITNNFITRGNGSAAANPWQWGGAAGVHLQNGGTLRQSLIADNTSTNDNFASAVLLGNTADVLMENCTVAENRGLGTVGNFYPVMYYAQYASTSPTVRNTLIYGNTGFGGNKELLNGVWDASAIGGLADVKFYNCATDSTLPTGFPAGLGMITTGITVSREFRPTGASSIIDAGASMASPVGLDLLGNPRIYGAAVDIGCYEYTGEEPPFVLVANPALDPATGTTFYPSINVTLTCATDGAAIRYTTNGSDPTEASALYTGPITLSSTTTIKVRAYKAGLDPSGIVSATYTYEVPTPGYYVSTTGSDANNGFTRETAFATLAHAVGAAKDGQWIRVLAGTYEITAAISVTEALAIVGDTGDPADVVVRNTAGTVTTTTGANSDTAHRVFEINHADAVLSGIAVEGGKLGGGGDFKGGNILIDSNGGTVTNCIIRNAIIIGIGPGGPKNGAGGAGIACLSANGLITHCVVTNNFATRGNGSETTVNLWQFGGAAGVHLQSGGTLRQSLIAFNTSTNDNFASAVLLGNTADILMENCTVVKNRGIGDDGNFYPVLCYAQSASQSPTVRNTLIYENAGFGGNNELLNDVWDNSEIGSLADVKFYNCATDSILPTGFPAGLGMITEGIALAHGFRPPASSSIVDKGAAMTSPVGLDLAGKPRVFGKAIDIGCYECQFGLGTVMVVR